MRGFILAFITMLSLVAKADIWNPTHILSTGNGLPTDAVRQIYQDKEGYIWIATASDGLCRYDGKNIKIYKSNLYTPGVLSSNSLSAIAEDGNNRIWIGTNKGLNVLDKMTGKIRRIDSKKLISDNIQVILTTRKDEVWIGTSLGLYKYLAETDSFRFYNNENTNFQLRSNDIKALIEDSQDNIWIGTWNGGLTRLDPEKDIFCAYPEINPQNSAHTIFEDSQRRIWVGSWGYGLFRLENPLDPEKVTYINYRHDKNSDSSLSDNIVYALSQDLNTGAIWVGTRSGLSILNDIKNPYSFSNHYDNLSDLPINELNSVIRDRSGLMWLGSLFGGVNIVNTTKPIFRLNPLNEVKKRISSNYVRSLYVDKQDVVWMGIGSRGLVSYHPAKNQYVFYEDHPDFKQHPINASVYSIRQIGNAYWIATYGNGIFIYDPSLSSEKVRVINAQDRQWMSSNIVYTLFPVGNDEVWIGTSEGLCIYNTQTQNGFSYPYLGQAANGTHYPVVDIVQSNENEFFVATSANGIFKAIRKNTSAQLEFQRYATANSKLNNDAVHCVFKDKKGSVWAGTISGGLNVYDAKKDAFVSVQQKYYIPGDAVASIIEDKSGTLWLGTNAGLVALKEDYSLQYTVSDGLQSNSFNHNAVAQTADGELFFGGFRGYNHFYPQDLHSNKLLYPTLITDIKIFNKSLDNINGKIRKKISLKTPGYTEKISLPYDYNNFTIDFATLRYVDLYRNKYAFMLEGFDKEWQYSDDSQRYASYNNLRYGTYKFRLKSLNSSAVWSEITPLEVEILQPFWLTWWAYLIYFALLGTIAFLIVKFSRHNMLINNTIHMKDIEKQKIEELNQVKLQFFTNITHEFLTPLTILSASVDELKIIAPQNSDFYKIMSNNINRLIRLLQQILEFRKAETGNLKLKVSQGDIAAFVKSCTDNFNPIMKKNKIHFSVICDPENIPAYFDHDKLDKILFNLLSNAAKYNKANSFVQVNVNFDSLRSNIVYISVSDNGEGISPDAQKTLFKRFYDGDYRSFNTIGTGIGLSLTKNLVELHKGDISVESTIGKGTTFYIKIPVNIEAYNENEIDNYTYSTKQFLVETVENGEPNKQDVKEHTLLLIEDNEDLLQIMVKLLQKDYNIFTATNGKEGINILENEFIDLTISDVMMPVMNGIDFCKYVKNKFEIQHIPIILLTAKNTEEDRVEAYDSGADGFISKPFRLNVLYAKIKNLLKTKEVTAKKFKNQLVVNIKELDYTSVDEDFLNRAVECVQKNIEDADFDQQKFADLLGTSKSTLYKKLKLLTGLNTSSFIKNIRLKAACKIIKDKKAIRISELAYAVGFNDPKYFSACFKKEFGLIPSEYLDRITAEEQKRENKEETNE